MDAALALARPLLVLCAVVPVVIGLVLLMVSLICYRRDRSKRRIVGFFHPYCDAGGGGERVLWCAVRAVQRHFRNQGSSSSDYRIIIYTGDDLGSDQGQGIITRAEKRFGVAVDASTIEFVYLTKRSWVEAGSWPRFTLLGQSIGSMVLAHEALSAVTPDVFLDTMGYAFTFPQARMAGCRVVCYVHYPTISTDMLQKVRQRSSAHNNNERVAKSLTLSTTKLIYYTVFSWLYGITGSFSEACMVNSTWTHGHIASLWALPKTKAIVYPPCDTRALCEQELTKHRVDKLIVSLAQFRPEKDHKLQVGILAELHRKYPQHNDTKLILIGSSRNAADEELIDGLKAQVRYLGLEDSVTFIINAAYADVKLQLERASVGLHTMWNEHFGIGIVEYMAAGAIPLAHDSGGPKADIVVPYESKQTGFLASDITSYCQALDAIFTLDAASRNAMRQRARSSVAKRFSELEFELTFLESITSIL